MPLEKLQKRAVRITTYIDSRTHSNPIFSQLQLLKLNDMYKLEIAKIMYKIFNDTSNICSTSTKSDKSVLLDNTHSYNTRRKQ